MPDSTLEEKCFSIFEHARTLYGAHAAHLQLVNYKGKDNAIKCLASVMEQSSHEIAVLGGKVETGTDSLGTTGPVITNADGKSIPYEIGKMEREKFLLIYANRN